MGYGSPEKKRAGLGAVPLTSLRAVVLDTETTGLDTAKDRIIQVGAIAMDGTDLRPDLTFDSYVDPGQPISEASRAIHGISDADVAGAEPASAVLPSLDEWIGARVILGFSIGFDLAVIRAEYERVGRDWKPHRSLCVRHLSEIVAPNLPNTSLDTLAEWLGIEIEDRHTALGDAVATAKVFAKMIPKLAAKNIRTLAQAERASLSLTQRVDEEARAGWHAVVSGDSLAEPAVRDFARIDSFPFQHRVGDVMAKPPMLIDAGASVDAAVKAMVDSRVSSVFLAKGAGDAGHGIFTERDVLRTLEKHGAAALERPVGDFAQRPLVTIDTDEFLYRAISLMTVHSFRHLGVVDAAGHLVGALSARDLLTQRSDDAVNLGEDIDHAENASDLGRVWSGLTRTVAGLSDENIDARLIASVISRELRALTRRACELAERAMQKDGLGGPPVPYAMLVLGSGGRGESLLSMDQDNAIVFAEGAPGGPEDKWFAELGSRVADMLDDAGVRYCDGGVMARNPEWRMDLAHWRETVGQWIGRSRPEDVLNCDIFFDSCAVHGDLDLGEGLRREALEAAATVRPFLHALRSNACDVSSALGMFGRFKLDDGRLDAKRLGLMPVFSAARILAIQNHSAERTTPARLEAARTESNGKVVDNLIEAHRIFVEEILSQQLRDIARGVAHGNKLAPAEINEPRRQRLRWAFEHVDGINNLLGVPVLG
jgi:CBS domain-containing protein